MYVKVNDKLTKTMRSKEMKKNKNINQEIGSERQGIDLCSLYIRESLFCCDPPC